MVGCGSHVHPSPTHLAARPQGQSGVPGVVPRRPEPAALLSLLGPAEVGASIVLGDLLCKAGGGEGGSHGVLLRASLCPAPHSTQHTCLLYLLGQCPLRTMELEEECGCHGAVQLAVPVAGIHHDFIQKLWGQGEGR